MMSIVSMIKTKNFVFIFYVNSYTAHNYETYRGNLKKKKKKFINE